jgi:hypothetical protein
MFPNAWPRTLFFVTWAIGLASLGGAFGNRPYIFDVACWSGLAIGFWITRDLIPRFWRVVSLCLLVVAGVIAALHASGLLQVRK